MYKVDTYVKLRKVMTAAVKKGVKSQVIDTFDNRIDEAKPIDFDSTPHVQVYYPPKSSLLKRKIPHTDHNN